jgi:uncharacterized protein (DUF952 family)
VALTFHGTPRDYFESTDASRPYTPAAFDADGFIHCTDGERLFLDTLSAYYGSEPGDWIALVIETDRVDAPVRYDDTERVFPHIYGPLNRDAIVDIRQLERDAEGSFVSMR